MSSDHQAANTFIGELAGRILRDHGQATHQVTVVFPNRRAGLFFQKSLANLITGPVWMPRVTSMEDFLVGFTPTKKIETLEAVFTMYEVYKTLQKKEETFDQFFFWGEMILRDFEEIDHYLVNPKNLFTSIKTQKELDEEFYFLDEEERQIIQNFWSSFVPNATRSQEAFLETWKILLPLYEGFQQTLNLSGLAYGGMLYRQLAEHTDRLTWPEGHRLYFAGFNALTRAEEKIIRHFAMEHQADIVWDLDAYYFEDKRQEAGHFLREYAQDPVLGKSFPKELPRRVAQPKDLEAIGVSLEVGQTKALAEKLAQLANQPDFSPEKTVIVLPQEYMLFPVLHAIPDSIDQINITMGYPLRNTPVYSLLESALVLQASVRSTLEESTFYFKPVVELVEHPLLFSLEPQAITELVGRIKKQNRIRVQPDELALKHPIFIHLFQKPDQPLPYLEELLRLLYETQREKGHDMELEFVSRFYEHLTKLHEMLGDRANGLGYDFLTRLFRRLAGSLKVPFTGEPLHGLQVMGILETRNLDFERVFILNMNEESWPAPVRRGSFVPYNIRKAFGMPVFDHQDAIYAYLFYRLVQRAQSITFFYNTVSEFNVNGELSRLVQQLDVESGHTIRYSILSNPVKTTAPKPICIEKTKPILEKMERFLDGYSGRDASKLTPSALNTYLHCRLSFYFKYIVKLYEPEEVSEEMDAMLFGNLLHDTMELLYTQFTDKEKRKNIHKQDIFWIRQGVSGALNETFKSHYGEKTRKKFKLEGRSVIAAEVLKKFINKILDHDEAYAPFQILGLEAGSKRGQEKYQVSLPVEVNGQRRLVRLKGIIDRIDLKEGTVRVLDYKTGRDEKGFDAVESMTGRNDRKTKAVFQVFFYSYLFMKNHPETYTRLEPGIFNSRDLFSEDFQWRVTDKKAKTEVTEFRQYLPEFEAGLSALLNDLYDPAVHFDQVEDEKKCSYCPYRGICSR